MICPNYVTEVAFPIHVVKGNAQSYFLILSDLLEAFNVFTTLSTSKHTLAFIQHCLYLHFSLSPHSLQVSFCYLIPWTVASSCVFWSLDLTAYCSHFQSAPRHGVYFTQSPLLSDFSLRLRLGLRFQRKQLLLGRLNILSTPTWLNSSGSGSVD